MFCSLLDTDFIGKFDGFHPEIIIVGHVIAFLRYYCTMPLVSLPTLLKCCHSTSYITA